MVICTQVLSSIPVLGYSAGAHGRAEVGICHRTQQNFKTGGTRNFVKGKDKGLIK